MAKILNHISVSLDWFSWIQDLLNYSLLRNNAPSFSWGNELFVFRDIFTLNFLSES